MFLDDLAVVEVTFDNLTDKFIDGLGLGYPDGAPVGRTIRVGVEKPVG